MNLAASALPLAARADVDRARDILLRHGWNATCYQILNPGIELWFSQRDDAVIGFTRAPYRWVAAGGPICAEEALRRVVQEFEEDAARHHCGVCFVLAVERLRALVKEVGRHSVLTLGAQPVWSPADWIIRYGQNASLRSQVRRATRKGVRIDLPSIDQVRADDGCRAALAEWLGGRTFSTLHFLTEPAILDGEMRGRVVMRARVSGQTVGFLIGSPVPARSGWLVEQIVRRRTAPNGMVETLIDAFMRWAGENNPACNYITLGLVAMTSHVQPLLDENPLWIRGLSSWGRAHLCRFYNFCGLETFRTKLRPVYWEPAYLISNETRMSYRSLNAVGYAFCAGPPLPKIVSAAASAARQEGLWLLHPRKS